LKTLVYDGDCPLCTKSSALAVRWGLVSVERRRPASSFTGEAAERLREAGIDRQLVVLDEATGETRGGVPGLLWLLGETPLRPVVAVLGLPPLRFVLVLVYRFVARNRRTLLRTRCESGACGIPRRR
jgi:predicted DCC family thiol-disulfide oxidoreductase YuxK